MFIQLFTACILFIVFVQAAAVTNSSQDQAAANALVLPKQASLYDDYDLNDKKTNVEGSGGGAAANLDDYIDEEDDQLSKVTATTISSTTLTTKAQDQKQKNESNGISDNFDTNEFKEDYADDLQDAVDYNELTSKSAIILLSSTPFSPTIQSSTVHHHRSIWILFSFLTRPPIAAGILAGLAIGILISVILLICIVRRFHRRQKSNSSSYTTGLLYPNQYGYSKSPQEFYA